MSNRYGFVERDVDSVFNQRFVVISGQRAAALVAVVGPVAGADAGLPLERRTVSLRRDGQKSQSKNGRCQRSPMKTDHFSKPLGCGSEQRLVYLHLEIYARTFACRSTAIGDNRQPEQIEYCRYQKKPPKRKARGRG
jgi:hypothetical protein